MIGLEIHEAASLGDHDALEEYIKSGRFDINQGDLNWGDKTPLHWASQKGELHSEGRDIMFDIFYLSS